ncbi:MAG: hypothetical protein LLF76_07505 [Planctomycetaceae bacterium]|nr:hypothetical protein [Planctomycetaceae bacterium]
MKTKFAVSILALSVIGMCLVYVDAAQKRPLLRVGVYDSRAIAIAYAASTYNEQQHQKLKAELDKAEAAGDAEKVKAIKEKRKPGSTAYAPAGLRHRARA